MKRLLLILGLATMPVLGACGGAEVTADENPSEEQPDFKAAAHGDITEGDVGADVDISEDDENEPD